MMSKTKSCINLGTIKEEICLPTFGHPAYRQRELIAGCYTERENLSSRCKGKAQAMETAKGKVPMRWNFRSIEETAVMAAEQRGSIVQPCQG